jgi:alpha-pyrone synthase
MLTNIKIFFNGCNSKKYPYIASISTERLHCKVPQNDALQILLSNYTSYTADVSNSNTLLLTEEMIRSIYNNTKISYRYMVNVGFSIDNNEQSYKYNNLLETLPIQQRNNMVNEIVLKTLITTCENAIQKASISKSQINKIVFVSSTYLTAPSLDCDIIGSLSLNLDIERTCIEFMGCAAGINGLNIATDFLNTKSTSAVLLIAVELSSLHMNLLNMTISDVITHAIFSDGIASVVVVGKDCKRTNSKRLLSKIRIIDHSSRIVENSKDGIELCIGDKSVRCILSPKLSGYIQQNIRGVVIDFLKKHKMTLTDIVHWVIHPGGRRIIEAVEKGLLLSPNDTQYSWDILNEYGNMLSCSIFYVLEKIIYNKPLVSRNRMKSPGLAISFSPGVGIECLLFSV